MPEFYDQMKDKTPDGPGGEYNDFYLKLRAGIKSYIDAHPKAAIAGYLLYLPDFFYMLVKLASDPDVPRGSKVQIVAALAYFISPIDIIPDALPGIGWLDDLYVALIVTDNLLNSVDVSLVERYWPAQDDIIHLVKDLMDRLNDKIGMGAIKRIVAKLNEYIQSYDKGDTK